jgi:outer membrane protein
MKTQSRQHGLTAMLLACSCLVSSFSFGDTLADIYELALKTDPSLKAAEANYRANLEVEKQAFSAMLPQVTANATLSNSDTSVPTENTTEDFGSSDVTTTTYNLSLSQTLFDLSTWFNFKSGKAVTRQAEAQLAADQQNLIVRVASAYFDVLRAQDNLQASLAEERATQRSLEQTQQRFEVGLIAVTDVHEARAVYDSTVVQRLTFEDSLGTALESLSILTGQYHSNLWHLKADFAVVNPEPMSSDQWVDFALENNFALKAALENMEAAKQNAKSKKMNHAPTLTGSYNYYDYDYDYHLPNSDYAATADNNTWSLTLSVPLYSGGSVSSSRRQAYEQYNAALQQQINTQRTVIRDARSSYITVATDVQRVKARSQSIVSASSALDATQAGYEVGTRNIVDVLNAQRTLYTAIRDHANSRYDYITNMLALKQAAGILAPSDIYDISNAMVMPDAPSANQYQEYLNQ